MLLILFKKFLGQHRSHNTLDERTESIEISVLQIQEGDEQLRNQIITDYQPFVVKITSKFSKRYINPTRDEEFSVALSAFNEAIEQFSHEAGRSFLSFAETVIRRRLIDYVRKEKRHQQQIPYSSLEVEDGEEHMMNPVEIKQAMEKYEITQLAEDRREEIFSLTRDLTTFGITFQDLVEASPKHTDSRKKLIEISVILAEDVWLMRSMFSKKFLPIKELLERVEISRKTLERNRKFIIAVALIYQGSYPLLREYLNVNAKVHSMVKEGEQ